jgi:hypothetical protein
MPFTLRAFENETKARMGVVECVTHRLVEPFQVLYEKDGKFSDLGQGHTLANQTNARLSVLTPMWS